MTVAPVSGHAPAQTGHGHPDGRFAQWALRLSAVFGAAFVASIAVLVLAYAFGVEGAVEDTLLGLILAIAAATGFLGSFAAFLVAIVAKVKHERWTVLWVPLCMFPAFLVFLVLGEAFWWE